MLWTDYNFDYGDQLARRYMKYKGEYYDVGTVCKIEGRYGPILVKFLGCKYGNQFSNKFDFVPINEEESIGLYNSYDVAGVMCYCLEIVIPVKPNLQPMEISKVNNREKPPSWDVEVAWIWYIVIMAVAVIFKDRWLIWGFTSAAFFLWKGGFLKGGKK